MPVSLSLSLSEGPPDRDISLCLSVSLSLTLSVGPPDRDISLSLSLSLSVSLSLSRWAHLCQRPGERRFAPHRQLQLVKVHGVHRRRRHALTALARGGVRGPAAEQPRHHLPPVRNLAPNRVQALLGSSCATGFDRYWRSWQPGRIGCCKPHTGLNSLSETGSGRAPAGTTKSLPTALPTGLPTALFHTLTCAASPAPGSCARREPSSVSSSFMNSWPSCCTPWSNCSAVISSVGSATWRRVSDTVRDCDGKQLCCRV
jgi:hypothetical protein